MSRVNPQIRLAAARRAFRHAQEACAHWDYETETEDMDPSRECCASMRDCARELRLAREACDRAKD